MKGLRTAILALLASTVWVAPAAANYYKINSVSVTPDPPHINEFKQKAYLNGDKLTIKCSISVVQYESGTDHVMLFISHGKTALKSVGVAPATGSDTVQASFTVLGAGGHSITCKVVRYSKGQQETTDEKTIHLTVMSKPGDAGKPIEGGSWPKPAGEKKSEWQSAAPPQALPPGGPLLPKPSLSIVGAQAKIDPACQSINHVLTAAVSVRNSGSPLAQGKGTVFVKEFGGASLSSAGIALPALGPNETKVVEIPVGTLSSFTPALPGQHQLTVNLSPVLEGGQPSFATPASAYQFPVSLPSGYCQAKLERNPGAGGARAVPPSGPPPQPARPPAPRP